MSKDNFRETAINELTASQVPTGKEACAFISAVAKNAGYIHINGKRKNFVVAVDGYGEALYLVAVLKELYPSEFEISADEIKSGSKKGERAYTVAVQSGYVTQLLEDTHIADANELDGVEVEVPKEFARDYTLGKAYLKGLFLACGGVYVPSISDSDEKKDGYHFEYRIEEEEGAKSVASLLAGYGVQAKISERGAMHLVYVKDKESVLRMLGVLDLYDCQGRLNKIIEERETANALNRAVICETANLDKTYEASNKQLIAIGIIEERDGLGSLSPILYETAQARLEYQKASLQELADILGVSKSCLNHRLRKLVEIAESGEN